MIGSQEDPTWGAGQMEIGLPSDPVPPAVREVTIYGGPQHGKVWDIPADHGYLVVESTPFGPEPPTRRLPIRWGGDRWLALWDDSDEYYEAGFIPNWPALMEVQAKVALSDSSLRRLAPEAILETVIGLFRVALGGLGLTAVVTSEESVAGAHEYTVTLTGIPPKG